jgi:hypothetical protein
MPNYAEEYALWYFRLNGFFPLPNFVIHKSSEVEYSADCDVLAIRPPHVYEEIGGNEDDWDELLVETVDFNRVTGAICEVKTSSYDPTKLFPRERVAYCIGRLGLVPRDSIGRTAELLEEPPSTITDDGICIAKFLIANDIHQSDRYLSIDLDHVKDFLLGRVHKYPEEKYRDRMFFGSIQFQTVIDIAVLSKDLGNRYGS